MRLQPVLPQVIGTPRAAYLTTKASPSMFYTGYGENVGKGLGALADAGLKAIRGFAAIDERNTDQIATEYAAACKQFITENQGDADALRSFDGRRQQILEQVTEGKGFYTSSRLQAKLRAIDYANTGYVSNRVQGLDRQADIAASQGMVEAASAAFTVDPSPETKAALRNAYVRLAQATGTYVNPGGAKRMQEDYDAGRILTSGGYREIVADDEADRHAAEDADRGRAFMENRIRQSEAERAVRTHGARAQAFEDGFQKLVDRAMLAHAKSYMDKGDYAAARAFMQQSDASDAAKKPFLDTCDRLIGLQDAQAEAVADLDGIQSAREVADKSSGGEYWTPEINERYLARAAELQKQALAGDEKAAARLKALQQTAAIRIAQAKAKLNADVGSDYVELSSKNPEERQEYIARLSLAPGNPRRAAIVKQDEKMRRMEAAEAARALRASAAAAKAGAKEDAARLREIKADDEAQRDHLAVLKGFYQNGGVIQAGTLFAVFEDDGGERDAVYLDHDIDLKTKEGRQEAAALWCLNKDSAKKLYKFYTKPTVAYSAIDGEAIAVLNTMKVDSVWHDWGNRNTPAIIGNKPLDYPLSKKERMSGKFTADFLMTPMWGEVRERIAERLHGLELEGTAAKPSPLDRQRIRAEVISVLSEEKADGDALYTLFEWLEKAKDDPVKYSLDFYDRMPKSESQPSGR